ncbi:MAG: sulfatase-like hydrolase/transferase, partial [Polyangiaceae bacterium]|nr:sulfatase-like hydrolase/transferase [Polyangiaceae bacterium]
LFATNFVESVLNQLWADAAHYAATLFLPFCLALLLLLFARQVLLPTRRVGRWTGWALPPILLGALFLPTQHRHQQASTPDTLYLHAMGGMLRTQLGLSKESHQLRPRLRDSLPVASTSAQLPAGVARRNVVFVILESVRKDATCNEYAPSCRKTEATNQLFPDRYPLNQLRALDSSTAISLAVLWSGVGPHEDRDTLHEWPLVFDYAKAAGYQTSYWTSQNMMFGNVRLWVKNLGVDSFFSATDVEPDADIDLGAHEGAFARRALKAIPELKEPFFLTIQLSNGHYPYLVDPSGPQPFQPSEMSKAPEDNDKFFNYYQNAVYQEDQHLAQVLSAIQQSDFGERTVIVYTSDHGEAFREHGQMGHTFSVFDEEVLVPAWIDAPSGTLSAEEVAALESKKEAFTFHPDLTVTLLDLLGVWDQASLNPYRSKILGQSLLRPEPNRRALPMTNCAGVWSCAFENWGFMQGSMKLEARAWDSEYQCFDVLKDPKEEHNLGAESCGGLFAQAEELFLRLPGTKED